MERKLRVLELYSGIGGMHAAMAESGIPFEVVAAIDINPTANKIYQHNYPDVNLLETGIEALTVKKLDKMLVDIILMSPPCQPFTRVGNKKDSEDKRTRSLFHLLNLLPQLKHCPKYILVENVKGFETSQTREHLVNALNKAQFQFQEFLLTPLQFGIPNSRLRYFLIAKQKPRSFSFQLKAQVLEELPTYAQKWMKYKKLQQQKSCKLHKHQQGEEEQCKEGQDGGHLSGSHDHRCCATEPNEIIRDIPVTNKNDSVCQYIPQDCSSNCVSSQAVSVSSDADNCSELNSSKREERNYCGTGDGSVIQSHRELYQPMLAVGHNMRQCMDDAHQLYPECLALDNFLETLTPDQEVRYQLSDKELSRFVVMDIVHPCMTKTSCFTKRYGHFVEGAGSVVQMTTCVQAVKTASDFKEKAIQLQNRADWKEEELSILRALKLRYFTPKEISNLLCFPSSYGFPESLSQIQLFRCLGNSLNVHVVSLLIRVLLHEEKGHTQSSE